MSWTTISDSEIAEGKPVTSILLTSIRDNFTGMADAKPGAPKFVFDVFKAPVAGGDHIVWMAPGDSEEITQDPISATNQLITPVKAVIRNAGDVRLSVESKRSSSGQLSFCSFAVNGAVVQEFTNDTDAYAVYTHDVTVAQGDWIEFYHRADDTVGPPISRRPRIYSAINTIIAF